MSAPDDAITLREAEAGSGSDGYLKELFNRKIVCSCGYRGVSGDLLCIDDEDTMWCPQCKTAGWQWA